MDKELHSRLFGDADKKLLAKFKAFHEKNPDIYDMFYRFTVDARNANREYFSHWMIAQRIRWYTTVETTGKEFKLSNDYIALYARLVIWQNPQWEGFFKFKKMKTIRSESME